MTARGRDRVKLVLVVLAGLVAGTWPLWPFRSTDDLLLVAAHVLAACGIFILVTMGLIGVVFLASFYGGYRRFDAWTEEEARRVFERREHGRIDRGRR